MRFEEDLEKSERFIRLISPALKRKLPYGFFRTDDSRVQWRVRIDGRHAVADAIANASEPGVILNIDFKAEEKWTGNIAAEHISNAVTGREGWLFTLPEDTWIIYGFLDRMWVVTFTVGVLKQFVEDNKPSLRQATPFVCRDGQQDNKTVFFIVPIIRLLRFDSRVGAWMLKHTTLKRLHPRLLLDAEGMFDAPEM